MKKKRKGGATRITEKKPVSYSYLSNIFNPHVVIFGFAIISISGIVALLPSSFVEAKRTGTSEDTEKLQSLEKDMLHLADQNIASEKANKLNLSSLHFSKRTSETAKKPQFSKNQIHQLFIKHGDNLSSLFQNFNLGSSLVYKLGKTPTWGKALSNLRPGEKLTLTITPAGKLVSLNYATSQLESILFESSGDTFTSKHIVREPSIKLAYSSGVIKNSLFIACQKSGLGDTLTMELMGIFAWDIDFAQDIRSGDSFSVLYEEEYLDGEKFGYGRILAATFSNRGNIFTAIHHKDSDGNSDYYTPGGQSMKKAFLRTPVEFTRISSKFNPNRLHPIFRTKRPHQGVDYAAPTNTPIRATGNGKIKFSGWKKGYGNVVYIQHPGDIVTIYAHQDKINRKFKLGSRVKQGDIIGYVGQTGWATGPHLHYEFLMNGKHRNPITVELPDAEPIPNDERHLFQRSVEFAMKKLEQASGTMVAQNRN